MTYKITLNSYDFSDKFLRLYAVACARAALALIKNPDPRSIKAIDIAEAYAYGKATEAELATAHKNAYAAAYAAATTADTAAYAAACAATAAYAHYAATAYYVATAYYAAKLNIDVDKILENMIKDHYTELELLVLYKGTSA